MYHIYLPMSEYGVLWYGLPEAIEKTYYQVAVICSFLYETESLSL